MEGQTISSLRTRMGAEEYAKAVACGDVIEKENHVGKLMAYEPKEKLHGIREVLTKKKDVASRSEFKPEDFHHFAAGIAAEAVQWCKFALFDEEHGVQGSSGSGSSGSKPTATISIDDAMKRVQEAYDTCTRTMSSIRDASRQLLLLVAPGSLQASATKACVVQASQMEPWTEKLEGILFGEVKFDVAYIKKVLRPSDPLRREVLRVRATSDLPKYMFLERVRI